MQQKIVCRNTPVFVILFLSIVAFLAYPAASHAADISGAEYFFDNDPGKGNGISLPAADGGFDSLEESIDLSEIDTSPLKIGNHTLYVRFISADGVWGMARPVSLDPFFRSPYNFRITGEKWIAGAEYFIDDNPGAGSGTPVGAIDGVFDDPEEELGLSGIDISHIGVGLHTLYLRVQDNEGTWGIIRQVTFEIYEPTTIVGAEYFIDEDPGSGSGTALAAKDGSFDSAEEQVELGSIATADLSEGVHTLFVRFKNNLNRWGTIFSQQFAIGCPVAYPAIPPIQPATGDGRIPLSIVVADQSGSDTCKLKAEYALDGSGSSDDWQQILIEQGSVSATYGQPALDNGAEYQIGNASAWIEPSSGPNTISFVWLSGDDLNDVEAASARLRFTVHNGTDEQVTSTESIGFRIDNLGPGTPVPVLYNPDPTGDTTPTLCWSRVFNAAHYHLQVATDAAFTAVVLDQSDITTISFTPSSPLPQGDIYWRVSAVDNLGNKSPFSIIDHFTIIEDTDPPSVTLKYGALSPVSAGPLTITALFSEPLATVPLIEINQQGLVDLEPVEITGNGDIWSYTYTVNCANGGAYVDGTASITISKGFDHAGNENTPAQNNSFAIDTSTCGSGTIIAAEYFLDEDPGEGNGIALSAADGAFDSSEESVDLSNIDTSSLMIGHHTLYVRFKNADGMWGVARPIAHDPDFVSPFNFRITGEKWLSAAEYFIDVDPGEGYCESVPSVDGDFDEAKEELGLSGIDISHLGAGPHTLYVRVQNNEGIWGIVRQVTFEIYEPLDDTISTTPYNFQVTDKKWITAAESFIDADPGVGHGEPVNAMDGEFDEPEENLDLSGIDISHLDTGLHTLYVRVKDNSDNWGIIRQVTFELYEPETIAGAEYFVDNDPGPGNGTSLSAKDGGFDSTEEQVEASGIDVSGLSEGIHTLYVRYKDRLDRWGAPFSQAFAVDRPVAYTLLPITQPATGDGRIPLSVVVADQSASNTCRLKVEYALDDSDDWQQIRIEEGSVFATYGSPILNNGAEYQVGGPGGWIETGSGPNTVSFVWVSREDLRNVETTRVSLRFILHNGTDEQVTSTESIGFRIDNLGPGTPVPVLYTPDPTGDTTPTLCWSKVFSAAHYHLQMATDAAFTAIVLDQSGITKLSYTPTSPLSYGNIYWRVSAVDGTGNESPFSIADDFTIIEDTDPPSVTLGYSAPSPVSAGPLTITTLFSEPMATVPEIAIDQPGNADLSPTAMIGSGTTWAYTYMVQCADGGAYVDGAATVTISNGFDYAGNENTPAQNNSFDIDTSACGSGNIIGAEYFFDEDPGKGNGISLQAADSAFDSPEESVNFSGIDTSFLTIGNHTLYVRFKNADGVWGLARPVSNEPLFDSPYNFCVTGEKWVAGAEYFIDIDPGEGNAEPVSVVDGNYDEAEEKLELSDIDISYLSAGTHTLYLRLQDNEGTWGIIRKVTFEIYKPEIIAGAEYFINDDPEHGNATPVFAKDGLFDSTEEQVELSGIDLSALSEGIHTLYVRFKDSRERWGSTDSQQFVLGDFLADADEDGMPNGWENEYGLNPTDPSDANEDLDNDGLSNLEEYLANTNPTIPDTDGDHMPDGWELTYGLNPIDASDAAGDPDSDGLKNIDEYLNNTDPNNSDTDNDGISDGDEVNYGNNPLAFDSVDVINKSGDVTVSLTGDNRLFVEVLNRFCVPKAVQFELSGLDQSWYSVEADDQSFTLMPFGRRVVSIQLHLPDDCNIPTQMHPFTVQINWVHGGQAFSSSDTGNLVVTPNPNIYPLAIPKDTRLAGNTIFVAWKTDIPATSIIKYRKLGDEEYIEVPVATDELEHRKMLTDLDYFTYYEFYTESHSSCGGVTATDVSLTKTGKAVKFVDNVNEFWVDRDYNQLVTLSITNTDLIDHTYQLSVVNNNDDIVVGFVGDGTSTREATLSPGESTDVELVIHAPDAQKSLYDIYLKIVSDEGEFDAFVDYSHAIVHVRPFVANLDIQPVENTPGMMTGRFRLINYGDTLSDIEVCVDEASHRITTINPAINHYRLENGGFVEFDIKAQEYATGTIYARSGDYVVSSPFEIGCPPGTDLKTYTVNDISIVAVIKDWYCTNKMSLELPFAIPRGFSHDDLAEAALEVNFSLPMSHEKYDPHTVRISINGEQIASLEDTIPEGQYIFRFPTSLINLGIDAPAENHLTVEAEGITEGQYIVVTDFKIILNVDEMKIDLCVPPKLPGKTILPDPETIITAIGPVKKYRPGDTVPIFLKIHNNDNRTHEGRLTILVENNSFHGEIPPCEIVRDIAIPPGAWIVPDILDENARGAFQYVIPDEADDIEYRLSATFENSTMNKTHSILNRAGFWVRTPLIIVHGIMGSELYEIKSEPEPKKVWSVAGIAASPCDNDLNYLQCEDKNGQPSDECEIRAGKVIKNLIETQFFGKHSFIIGDIFTGLENYLIKQKYKFHRAGSEDDVWFDIQNIPINSEDSEDVFYFVYDWRLGNSVNAGKLKIFIDNLIEEIKAAEGTPYSKVNIIAHSMGGLVSKDLLAEYPLFEDKINKVIFVGTPNLGAVEPFSMMKHGLGAPRFGNVVAIDFTEDTARLIEALSIAKDSVSLPEVTSAISGVISVYETSMGPDYCHDGLEYVEVLLQLISVAQAVVNPPTAVLAVADIASELYHLYNLDKDLNGIRDSQLKKILRDMPSAYQLLPSEKYLSHYSEGYYELNGMLLNLDSTPTMNEVIASFGDEAATLLAQAITFHARIDEFVLPDKSYAIAGCKKCTTALIEEIEEPLTLTFVPGDGDETVPLQSALDINVHKKYAAQYAKHSNLPSQKGIRLLTRSLLKGYETEFQTSPFHPVAEYQEGFCGLPNGMRIVIQWPDWSWPDWSWPDWSWPDWSWSFGDWPKIKTPDGRVNIVTGNDIVVNILGSNYRIVNDGVEIFVPEGSVYTLQFHGVDREYLDIKFQLMTEGGVIKTYVFFDIPLELGGNGEIDIDLTDMMTGPVLRLDQDGDGNFETTGIPPSYVLDVSQSSDFTDPATEANITGTMGQDNWYVSNVSAILAATDNTGGSGILASRYRLQGDETFTDYSGPIQITEPGNYALTYYSIDKNLNKETEKVLELKIDNVGPQVMNVTDAGYFSLNSAIFSAFWDIQTDISGVQDVRYSLGTAPGSTDVIDWTSAGPVSEIQATGLSLAESCTEQIYINVQAVNGAGLSSEIASSDGVVVLESGGDPDGDGYDNESELAAGSNPCNELSIPKETIPQLKKGFNFLSIPADVEFQQDLKDWLSVLGDATEIEKVMVYDEANNRFITLIPEDGSNPIFMLQGGEGLIVYAKQDKEITFTSVLCSTLDLKPEFNLVGFACPEDGYSAYNLLNDLGSENVSSIQRYSTEKGAFETAGFDLDGQLVGVDFPIVPGEGYFVYRK